MKESFDWYINFRRWWNGSREILNRFTFLSSGCVHRSSQGERYWSQTESSRCRLEHERAYVRELQEPRRTFASRRQHFRDCCVNGGQFNGAGLVNEQQVKLISYLRTLRGTGFDPKNKKNFNQSKGKSGKTTQMKNYTALAQLHYTRARGEHPLANCRSPS